MNIYLDSHATAPLQERLVLAAKGNSAIPEFPVFEFVQGPLRCSTDICAPCPCYQEPNSLQYYRLTLFADEPNLSIENATKMSKDRKL